MLCGYSNLENAKIEKIKALEKEIGKTMLAVSCQAVQASELTEEQLKKIRDLEQSMGMVLVAINV
jgi:hypothetical protein